MKQDLTQDDVRAAVIGGAILGGGGGGFIEAGMRRADLALQLGVPQLWSVDEFDADDATVTVALVGAPAAPDPLVLPTHLLRALELLRRDMPNDTRLAAVHTNENGAETTVNAWLHSAMTGLPVIDLACNGRAHPTSVMGAMSLDRKPGYVSLQGYAGGRGNAYVEGAVSGSLASTSAAVRQASVLAGGWVGVARNPVPVSYAERHGAPGAITFAMDVGYHHLDGGVTAVAGHLGGQIVAEGVVTGYRCDQEGGLDVGAFRLEGETHLQFVNEYMVLEDDGKRAATFPDLITTFDEDGNPVASAEIRDGQRVTVMTAPADRLLLSPTMYMPELYEPLEKLLGIEFAPRASASV